VTSISVLSTDAYKFSMAQAGFPLRRETFYFSFRRGGIHYVPVDLERSVRELLASLAGGSRAHEFARRHGYGFTDAMEAALAVQGGIEIEAVPRGSWVCEREPILTITGPSFLVSWLEPMLLWLNYPIQLATALRGLEGAPVPSAWVTATCAEHARVIESALADADRGDVEVVREDDAYRGRVQQVVADLVRAVGDPNRVFEVGMRSAVCLEQHRIALEACRAEGVLRTSHVGLALELDMQPVGTMGHEHVQRWGADLAAFGAMRDMRSSPPSSRYRSRRRSRIVRTPPSGRALRLSEARPPCICSRRSRMLARPMPPPPALAPKPAPSSSTTTRSRPSASSAADSATCTGPTLGSAPCLTAFSTSDTSISGGQGRACSAGGTSIANDSRGMRATISAR